MHALLNVRNMSNTLTIVCFVVLDTVVMNNFKLSASTSNETTALLNENQLKETRKMTFFHLFGIAKMPFIVFLDPFFQYFSRALNSMVFLHLLSA